MITTIKLQRRNDSVEMTKITSEMIASKGQQYNVRNDNNNEVTTSEMIITIKLVKLQCQKW